ncbi:MAG: helix-turn-helix domain-containing protein [Patescibacteria group bacterium]
MPRFSSKKIEAQVSFGELLRLARERQGLTFKQVSFQIKMPECYLKALEEENLKALPAGSYGRHFLREYALYLGLSLESLIKEYDEHQLYLIKAKPALPGKSSLLPSWWRLSWVILGVLALALVSYLGWEARRLFLPPPVELINPPANIIVNELQIMVKGHTALGAQITLNGERVSVRDDGFFSQEVVLQPGLNTITVSAVRAYSQPVVIIRQVLSQTLPQDSNP